MKAPTLGEVRAFVAVADHLNFAHAATELGVSPSTLSSTVRLLEDRLGIRLLNRTTRKVALTAAGQSVLAYLRPMLDNYSAAMDLAHALQGKPAGLLRLVVTPTAAQFFLMPLIAGFLAEYPDISIEISSRASGTDVVGEAFDAGIRVNDEGVDRDMIAVRISDPFQVITVAAPGYLERSAPIATPRDLRHHNCIRLREYHGGIFPWRFHRQGKPIAMAVEGSIIVSDYNLMILAALEGIGVAQTTLSYARPLIEDGRLVPILHDWDLEMDGFYIYYAGQRQVPAHLRALIDFLMKKTRKLELAPAPTRRVLS